MSMTVGASSAAQVSQQALQQTNNDRQEKVENDQDGDDQKSAVQAQPAPSGGAQSGTTGSHVNTFA